MIYIPEKILVGFQKRTDTFDGKLSYIIYYDEKGVLRKEKSWDGWRDKNIPSIEIKNEPFKSPYLNKGVQRTGYSFSSGRSMLRVYDPRGFEYEITIPNFVGITQYCNMTMGEFSGEFVYAFEGTQLILLPVDSEQYKEAKKNTVTKNTKVSVKDLVPGNVYRTNDGKTNVYIGKYNINENLGKTGNVDYKSTSVKPIFYVVEEEVFKNIPAKLLGEVMNTLTDEELNKYLDVFVGSRFEKKVKEFFILPVDKESEEIKSFLLSKTQISSNTSDLGYYSFTKSSFLLGYKDGNDFTMFNFFTPGLIKSKNEVFFDLNNLKINIEYSSVKFPRYEDEYDAEYRKFIYNLFKDKDSLSYSIFGRGKSRYTKKSFNTIEEAIEWLNVILYDALKELLKNNIGIVNVRFKDGSTEVLKKESQKFIIG